jgi:hypothetical protein
MRIFSSLFSLLLVPASSLQQKTTLLMPLQRFNNVALKPNTQLALRVSNDDNGENMKVNKWLKSWQKKIDDQLLKWCLQTIDNKLLTPQERAVKLGKKMDLLKMEIVKQVNLQKDWDQRKLKLNDIEKDLSQQKVNDIEQKLNDIEQDFDSAEAGNQ